MDIEMKLTTQDTMQRILDKINDELDAINGNLDADGDAPPKDLRIARVVNELSQSYAFLAKNECSQKNINV